ncbi:transmembrane protein, putative (macronuclear) [Tetrahymena thermophila SB210]|uniref:Transmembrane protein, putative n=1 Tax=Tetrahymena thermophila (strain SB210) TaxID=312017 RepID=W7X7W6_TETTS|nr:transmembrane protein, putative [Tetrahymena thermophila SB210]EWS73427.1 transmembrane protein, putative [Tetrahymena thermophila SB210]|eukprot:XP_012654043.1 transmembrane protein, putative [Tetrahymena thermophila SB210]
MTALVKLKQKYIDEEDQNSYQSESNQKSELNSDHIEIHLDCVQLKSEGRNPKQNDKCIDTLQQGNVLNIELDNNSQQQQTQKDIFDEIQRIQSLNENNLQRTTEQGDIYQQLDLNIDLSQQQLKVDIQECNKQIKQKYYLRNDPKLNKQRRYKLFESIYQTKIETNFFCWRSKNNDTDQLSLSSLLYLNQIKSFICLFFLLFILGLPSFYICSRISKGLNYEYINDFQAFLLYPTIAGIGYKFWQCDMITGNKTLSQTADLKCPYGTLDFQFAQIGLTSLQDTPSFYGCEFIELQKIEIGCLKSDLSTLVSFKNIYSRCQNKSTCKINSNELLNLFDVKNGCDSSVQSQNIFISVPCRNQNVDIFGIPTTNYQASIAVVLLQTIGIIICLIFFIHQLYVNNKIKKRIKNKITMIQKFSIEIENIPKMHFNWTQELLWLHLQKNLDEYNENKSQREIKIIDIQMALPECIIKRDLIMKKHYESMKNKVIRFINSYDPNNSDYGNGIKIIQIDQLRKIFDSVLDPKIKQKCYKDLLNIIEKKSKIEKIKEQINKIEYNKYKHSSKAFVTFETKHQRDRAILIMQETLVGYFIKQFLYIFIQCFSKKYQFSKFHLRQNVLLVQKTVSPDILIWQNVFVGEFLSTFQLVMYLIIPIILCALGFFLINFGDFIRTLFLLLSPTINCYEYRFDDKSILNKHPQDPNQVLCFCSNNSIPEVDSCSMIYEAAKLKRLFPYFIMLIVNILCILSVKLAKYFVNKYTVSDKISKEIVLFQILSLFKIGINIGIYYILNKFPFKNNDQIQATFGNYIDFSPEWYRNVGMFFVIYYLIKIALYLIENIVYLVYRKVRLLIDRKCKKKKNITFQKTNFDYIKMHQGPEFEIANSYSQVLEYLCVSMFFGFGMPFFYFITFLFLILHLCFEKYYIFRHCRKESYQYNSKISNAFMSFYFYAILTSFLFLAMTYVNKRIFFEIYLQNTDLYNSQFNEQNKVNQLPTFTPQNFQSKGSYFMKISTYTYAILFVCYYFRQKIKSFFKYLSYISKYKIKRKVQNCDYRIQKYPFDYKSLYQLYSIRQLKELSLLQDYYTEREVSDIRKQRFINKKKDIDQVIKQKLDENLDLDYSEKPVSGSLNYDIILNQNCSRYFDWKTELSIFKMNKAKKEEIFSKLTESLAIKKQIQGIQNKESACKLIQQYKKQIKSRYQSFKDLKKNETTYTQDNSNQIKFVFKIEDQKQQNQIEQKQEQMNIAKSAKSDSIIQISKDSQNIILEDQILSQEQLYSSRVDHHQTLPQFYQVRNTNVNQLNVRQIQTNEQI